MSEPGSGRCREPYRMKLRTADRRKTCRMRSTITSFHRIAWNIWSTRFRRWSIGKPGSNRMGSFAVVAFNKDLNAQQTDLDTKSADKKKVEDLVNERLHYILDDKDMLSL